MIKKLYEKCVKWSGYRLAKPILALVAFAESFIFPVPTDVMIIPMVIAKRDEFFKIALIAIIFSVLGALIGYMIGYIFFNEIGIKIFEIFGIENANIFKEKLSTEKRLVFGILILFIAGFTPLPFKIITISSGFVHFNILLFIVVCFAARGLRFFLVAFLTYKYGKTAVSFLEKKGGKWTIIVTTIIIIIAACFYLVLNK